MSGHDYRKELAGIVKAAGEGAFRVQTRAVRIIDVETAWTESLGSRERIVFVT